MFRIRATGGTLNDVTDFVDVTLALACGVGEEEFIWNVQETTEVVVIRKDYIPGWTVPYIFSDPLNPANDPVYTDPATCPIELPITWSRVTNNFDDTNQ